MQSKSENFGLSSETVQKINDVFENYHDIDQVLIYGSRAKGNYLPGSDIDLTIIGEKVEFSQLLRIEGELDDLLLPYKIDLSLIQLIENQDLIDHIKRVGQIFYAKQPN